MDATKLQIEKLTNTNYDSWSFKVKMLLVKDDLWKFVLEDCPAPVVISATSTVAASVENQTEIDKFKIGDNKALAVISLLVDNSQLNLVRNATSAKNAWKSIKDHHQKDSLAYKGTLYKRLNQMRLSEGGDLESHLNEMEDLFSKLSSLGRPLEEDLKVIMVIASLPDSYSVLTTALEARADADLTLNVVKSKLIDEYIKRNGSTSDRPLDRALKVQCAPSNSVICHYCKKTGHMKRDCWKLKAKESGESKKDGNEKKEERSFFVRDAGLAL